ncbi:hypothetical protein LCGC14_2026030 [marine sediment metagenome]|uniref:Bacteriophage tail tape measure C-terminal domain-containing protein n=1 Tax=marine sediment metagenome TaxID=412755 RepID=A0A0F9EW37_9ZZZZ
MRGATGVADKFRGTVGRLGGSLAVLFGGRALLGGIKKSITAFNVQETAVANLRASLVATGKDGAASLKQLTDSASEFQRVTTAGDEAIIAATASMALLAPALDTAALKDAQSAIIGIAETFTKGDLESAALLIGKSVGSATNALTRYGIQVDTTATQQEKMAQILAQSGNFFEVAKAKALSTGGAMQRLGNFIGDLRETIGGLMIDIVGLRGSEGLGGIQTSVENLNIKLQENSGQIIRFGKVFVGVMKVIALSVGNAFQIVGKLLGNIGALLVGIATFDIQLVKTAITEMKNDIVQDVGDIAVAFANFSLMLEDLGGLASNVAAGASATTAAVKVGVTAPIISELSTLEEAGVGAGRSLIRGLIRGIDDMKSFLRNIIDQVAEDLIIGGLEKKLGISSPSRVAAQIGRQTIAGFIGGMKDAAQAVPGAVGSSFALAGAGAGGGGGNGGGGMVVNQTINFSPSFVDEASGAAWLRANRGTIQGIMREAARDAGSIRGAFGF